MTPWHMAALALRIQNPRILCLDARVLMSRAGALAARLFDDGEVELREELAEARRAVAELRDGLTRVADERDAARNSSKVHARDANGLERLLAAERNKVAQLGDTLEAETAGLLALREELGAMEHEGLPEFVRRVARERDALKAHASDLKAERDALDRVVALVRRAAQAGVITYAAGSNPVIIIERARAHVGDALERIVAIAESADDPQKAVERVYDVARRALEPAVFGGEAGTAK